MRFGHCFYLERWQLVQLALCVIVSRIRLCRVLDHQSIDVDFTVDRWAAAGKSCKLQVASRLVARRS